MEILQQSLDFDFTFYRTDTKNQLIRVNTTAEKRRFRWINAGKIRNTGIEVTVGATPLMNDNFRWKLSLTSLPIRMRLYLWVEHPASSMLPAT